MSTLELAGCRPEPLLSYLKALGVFRLVSQQRGPEVRAHWSSEVFVLHCGLNREELTAFLVDDYEPTPIVTPWNGRGGFDPDKNRTSERVVGRFRTNPHPRLASLRRTIAAAYDVYEVATTNGWDRTKDKRRWVSACRARFPDAALDWLDAAVVLIEDDVAYPPLLGSGGNFGSFDAANNFLQRLEDVLCLREGKNAPSRDDSLEWADAALFAEGDPRLVAAKVGQNDPGRAGENKSSPLGERDSSIVNPWDYVLGLEGTLLFASAAARRLGATSVRAAAPFTVRASPAGYPHGSDVEASQADEIWAPLWGNAATLAEIRGLIGEGRAVWGGTPARSALDFVRAVTSLGVDRGIDAFVRHVLVERFGQASLAVPVGRTLVQSRSEVPLLRQLDGWTVPIRSRSSRDRPAAVNAALHRLDAAQFAVAQRGGRRLLQDVLVALAELESAVAAASSFRDRRAREPVAGLAAHQWLEPLDDGTAEFRVAAALASGHDPLPAGRDLTAVESSGSSLALLLRPVRLDVRTRRLRWAQASPRLPGLGTRATVEVLALAHRERVVDAMRDAGRGATDMQDTLAGVQSAYKRAIDVEFEHAAVFARGEIDAVRVGRLLRGLLLLDWHPLPVLDVPVSAAHPLPADPAWAVLGPFFYGSPLPISQIGRDSTSAPRHHQGPVLKPEATWVAQLLAGHVEAVVTRALLRLRMARLDPAVQDPRAVARCVDGPRLAAVLLTPLSSGVIGTLLRQIAPAPILQGSATNPGRIA